MPGEFVELGWNQANLSRLLTSPQGPVYVDLARRAVLVESRAKQNASQPHRFGPNTGSEPGGGPAVRSGRLRGSITFELGHDAHGPWARIGTNVFYAPFVEGGTSRMAARPFIVPALGAALF